MVAYGIGTLYLALKVPAGTLYPLKSLEEIKARAEEEDHIGIESYNWERAEYIYPIVQPIIKVLIFGRFCLFLAQLCYPRLARLNVIFHLGFPILFALFPVFSISEEPKIWLTILLNLYTAVALQTDFLVTFLVMLVALISDFFIVTPIMYTDDNAFEKLGLKIVFTISSLLLFIGWNCLITLLSNLYTDNMRCKEENTQLLNWIPNAVILQSFNKAK